MASIRRNGSAAPHSNWSPTVKAVRYSPPIFILRKRPTATLSVPVTATGVNLCMLSLLSLGTTSSHGLLLLISACSIAEELGDLVGVEERFGGGGHAAPLLLRSARSRIRRLARRSRARSNSRSLMARMCLSLRWRSLMGSIASLEAVMPSVPPSG